MATPFVTLFDRSPESAELPPALAAVYGRLGFPAAPAHRPWVYSNFVETIDGLVSLGGDQSAGSDIAQSPADRWLMDLLRVHAHALLIGGGTVREDARTSRDGRGYAYRIRGEDMRAFRQALGLGRERLFVFTRSGDLDPSRLKAFHDPEIDTTLVTTPRGADRLGSSEIEGSPSILVSGREWEMDWPSLFRQWREAGIERLLCEGGPRLYGLLSAQRMVDEHFLTIAPVQAGQSFADSGILRPTMMPGPAIPPDRLERLSLLSVRAQGDHLFLRYRSR